MKKIIVSIIVIGLISTTSIITANASDVIHDQMIDTKTIETFSYSTNDWALLVAPDFGDLDFVSKARYFKDVLIYGGWSEDHIITLFNENATKEKLINASDQIVENTSQSDTVLVFICTHGGVGCFMLMDYMMDYDELDWELDNLSSANVGVVIHSCHSGSAIPYLQQDGRVIITSCRHNESGGYFSYGFITGLIGFADKTGTGDNNEMVSMEETFDYCMDEYDWPNYLPQIQDNYTGQLNLINLNVGSDKMDQFPNYTMRWNGSILIGGSEYDYNYQAAQSFKPSFDVLTKARLCVDAFFQWTDPDIVYPLRISIRNNLTGEDLTSISIPPSKVIEYNGYHTFDFPDIQVTPYTTYYIVVNISSEATELQYTWHGREDECYSNGKSYWSSDNGETWQDAPSGAVDLLFVTYGYSDNKPPDEPSISGPSNGAAGEEHEYIFITTDPDGDDIYLYIDWGDDQVEEWIGPYGSGEEVMVSHTWDEQGSYIIKAKAKDIYGAESDWSDPFPITMPTNQISAKSVAVMKSIQTIFSSTAKGMSLLR